MPFFKTLLCFNVRTIVRIDIGKSLLKFNNNKVKRQTEHDRSTTANISKSKYKYSKNK